MKKEIGFVTALALLAPAAALAVEAAGTIKEWDRPERAMVLVLGNQSEVACKLADTIYPPLTMEVGRRAEVTYRNDGGENICESVRLR